MIFKNTTLVGVAGQYYDQIAVDADNTTGNIRMGAYDESAGEPNTLLSETASLAMTADYAFKSMPEFALTTNQVWLGRVKSSAGNLHQKNATGDYRAKTHTYGTLPNPAGSGYSSGNFNNRMKLGHS